MVKLPKGPLKVIHVNSKAITENELRVRAAPAGRPRRLVPAVAVFTADAKHEGFGVRIKGEARVMYETTRFPHGHRYGTPAVRCWLETNGAVEIAETIDELSQDAKDVAESTAPRDEPTQED